jgi:heme exporter protein B
MWRDAAVVAAKDLRIEARSRVGTGQVLPFALMVLVLFGFALDSERTVLERTGPGLLWVAVLLSAVLAVQRSFAIEADDDAHDALRLSGLDAGGIFLGKAAAVAAQLVVLEAALVLGLTVLFGVSVRRPGLLALTCLLATVGLASAGTLYGMVASGLRVRETLVPMLVLPVLAPVLLAAARASDAALGAAADDVWPWLRVLATFASVYLAVGVVAFGALMEEA